MRASPASLSKLLVLTAFAFGGSNAFGSPEANDISTTARVTVRGSEVREFDWAKVQARARIAFVSSGPRTQSARMIDNDLQTAFRFSESDKSPTVIVELAKSTGLHRVSTVFKAEDTELSVYLLNELPKDPSDLRFAKPNASVVGLPDERGMATVNVSVSSARYVALRWKRKNSQDPFAVAEISAFSNDPADLNFGDNVGLADNAKSFSALEPPIVPVVSQ
jgi:hypothetical protein